MDSQVIVCADDQGRVVIPTSNPEFSYIKAQQTVLEFNARGWLQAKPRTTLIKGATEMLDRLKFKAGQQIPGRIVVIESLAPQSETYGERELKRAGETGVICRVDDQPIYRNTYYDPSGTKEDILLEHTNADEIKEANRAFSKLERQPVLA